MSGFCLLATASQPALPRHHCQLQPLPPRPCAPAPLQLMGKNKVLVKVNPEGKYVVDLDKVGAGCYAGGGGWQGWQRAVGKAAGYGGGQCCRTGIDVGGQPGVFL